MAATSTTTLIDVVVLVFARSDLKALVGTDALRTVLNGSQRAMFPEPQTMSLQPVWDLLESQPGFDADLAIAPMCRLKTWEGQLKVKIQMPVALEHLDKATREKQAFSCNVGDDELNKILKPVTKETSTARIIESSKNRGSSSKRRIGMKFALGFATVGIIAAGISLYLTFGRGSSNIKRLTAAELSTEIPMTNVRMAGTLIVATVSDAAWLNKPEPDRRKQIETTAPKITAQQASGLMLVDQTGAPLAIYRLDKRQVSFTKKKR
jgi:hypothetical protein